MPWGVAMLGASAKYTTPPGLLISEMCPCSGKKEDLARGCA